MCHTRWSTGGVTWRASPFEVPLEGFRGGVPLSGHMKGVPWSGSPRGGSPGRGPIKGVQ